MYRKVDKLNLAFFPTHKLFQKALEDPLYARKVSTLIRTEKFSFSAEKSVAPSKNEEAKRDQVHRVNNFRTYNREEKVIRKIHAPINVEQASC